MISRVIGGEYAVDLDISYNCESETRSKLYASGRGAFRAILEHDIPDMKGEILLPDYICESVPNMILSLGLTASFYHINEDFLPEIESILKKINGKKAIVLVNYFGMISSTQNGELIDEIKRANPSIRIIIDDVQNYFGIDSEDNCDYAFTSFRKWFPVPDGARAIWKNGEIHEDLYPDERFYKKTAGFSRYKYAGNLLKNYRSVIGDEVSLELLEKGEKMVPDETLCVALPTTGSAIAQIDMEQIKEKRKRNAAVLHEGLMQLGIKHLYAEGSVPLFVPIILDKGRDKVREKMFSQSVFCPIHWSCDWITQINSGEINTLADKELSLICDHRYDENDMKKQLEILENACANI